MSCALTRPSGLDPVGTSDNAVRVPVVCGDAGTEADLLPMAADQEIENKRHPASERERTVDEPR